MFLIQIVPNCQGAFEQGTEPVKTEVDFSHVMGGWAITRMCLYKELAGLALAVPVERHLKKKIYFSFCFVFYVCVYT